MSSLLGHYALLYGPGILLLMNIAYYLPSIPLLLFSAFCDDWLDRKFGRHPAGPILSVLSPESMFPFSSVGASLMQARALAGDILM